ncbi:hypothetical protein [Vibrio lentus]|uniref:hypothetical protein n=1 Tax=Vibrio lentus TaxID=136468 RepID=UPI000C838A96|nr:hypothetical protein [Vibrio lentus]PMH10908.1 hypothetical protein BCU76_24580 [Vibrio lentus]PMK91928.1 hypothetical protein BCT89_22690 [Vibrio lentus]
MNNGRCKKMINEKQCSNPIHQDGLCKQHYKDRSLNTAGGAIIGAGLAGLMALNPIVIVGAAVIGAVVGAKSSDSEEEGDS